MSPFLCSFPVAGVMLWIFTSCVTEPKRVPSYKRPIREKVVSPIESGMSVDDHQIYHNEKHDMNTVEEVRPESGLGHCVPRLEQNQVSHSGRGNRSSFVRHLI
jgi:hypothetical protein